MTDERDAGREGFEERARERGLTEAEIRLLPHLEDIYKYAVELPWADPKTLLRLRNRGLVESRKEGRDPAEWAITHAGDLLVHGTDYGGTEDWSPSQQRRDLIGGEWGDARPRRDK